MKYDELEIEQMDLQELGNAISSITKEWSQGWSDSGCFWRFQYGGRGCGSMMNGFGTVFNSDVDELWEDYVDGGKKPKEASDMVELWSRRQFLHHLMSLDSSNKK